MREGAGELVAMLDGKSTALPSCDDHFAQRQSTDSSLIGLLRTLGIAIQATRGGMSFGRAPRAAHRRGRLRHQQSRTAGSDGPHTIQTLVGKRKVHGVASPWCSRTTFRAQRGVQRDVREASGTGALFH